MAQTDLEKVIEKGLSTWRFAPDIFVENVMRISQINPDYKVSRQQKRLLKATGNMVLAKLKIWEKQKGAELKHDLSELEQNYAEAFGMSVMAGKGVGKDAVTAWLVLWFLTCFEDVKVLVTAPKSDMIKTILWSEISKWHQARLPNGERAFLLHECIVIESEKIYKKTKENAGKRNFAIPKIAQKNSNVEEQKAALSGEHSEYMMVIADEASGVPDAVFEPLENTLTRKCNFALLIGNPNKASGFFYGTHYGDVKTRKKWIPFQWNAEESDIVSPQQIQNMRDKYGEDSDNYRVNVLGLPPAGGEGTLIPYSWIYDASVREVEPLRTAGRVLGVDVAGSGVDKTVLLLRQGAVVVDILKFSGLETEAIVNNVLGYAYDNEVDAICIDSIGVGAGVYSYVKKSFPRTHGVVVSRSARRAENFVNLRSELWWKCRLFFEDAACAIPDDKELIEQLADIRYESEMHGGKISVEKKRDLKRRKGAGASPDVADALCLSLYVDDRTITKEDTGDKWSGVWGTSGEKHSLGFMGV